MNYTFNYHKKWRGTRNENEKNVANQRREISRFLEFCVVGIVCFLSKTVEKKTEISMFFSRFEI